MSLICCNARRKSKEFDLIPEAGFIDAKLFLLEKCPACGHKVVLLLRQDYKGVVSGVRKINQKAEKLKESLSLNIINEVKPEDKTPDARFYLNYQEFGTVKRCYSNLKNLKIGLIDIDAGLPKKELVCC